MKKDKEVIDIDSKLVTMFSDFVGDSSNRIDYAVDNSQTNFKPLKKIGFFSKGLSEVEKGLSEIQNSMKAYGKILDGYYTDLNELERKLITYVDGIKIPDNLVINNSFSLSTRNSINLKKEDGIGVKSGTTASVEDIKVGEVTNKESIVDISKDDVNKVSFNDKSIIYKKMLDELNHNTLNKKEIDEKIISLQNRRLEPVNINNAVETNLNNQEELPKEEEKEQENDYEVEV